MGDRSGFAGYFVADVDQSRDPISDLSSGQTDLFIEQPRLAVRNEAIRQANAQHPRRWNPSLVVVLPDPGAKAPGQDAVFDCHKQVVLSGKLGEQRCVERLRESRVGDRYFDSRVGKMSAASSAIETPCP